MTKGMKVVLVPVLSMLIALTITATALAVHARPKSATPTRVSLVPAHKPCAAPNNTHNPILALPSCSPAVEESSLLTMPAPDRAPPFNLPSTGAAYFQLKAYCTNAQALPCTAVGDQLDNEFSLVFSGILCKTANPGGCTAAGATYNGTVGLGSTALRITDHQNSAPPTGTMVDIAGFFNSTCVNGNCSVVTSADAFFGGNAVVEGGRANWEFVGLSASLHAFDIYDEGLDGNFSATADNQVFLRAGLFDP
jgi:hypothetical protein